MMMEQTFDKSNPRVYYGHGVSVAAGSSSQADVLVLPYGEKRNGEPNSTGKVPKYSAVLMKPSSSTNGKYVDDLDEMVKAMGADETSLLELSVSELVAQQALSGPTSEELLVKVPKFEMKFDTKDLEGGGFPNVVSDSLGV